VLRLDVVPDRRKGQEDGKAADDQGEDDERLGIGVADRLLQLEAREHGVGGEERPPGPRRRP